MVSEWKVKSGKWKVKQEKGERLKEKVGGAVESEKIQKTVVSSK